MIDPEVERARIQKIAKYGFIMVGLAITAPLAFYALEGLIMWGALIGGGMVIANFAPAFSDWLANKKVQAIIAIAEANPIETMLNLYREKSIELSTQGEAVEEFNAQYLNVKSMVADLQKTDPEEAVEYAAMAAKMNDGLVELKQERQYAADQLVSFKSQIDKAQRIFNVAKAMNKALEKSQSAQMKVFADIKEKVAFDKVRTDLNRAFAKLDSAVTTRRSIGVEVEKPKELSPVVEGEVIQFPTPQVRALSAAQRGRV